MSDFLNIDLEKITARLSEVERRLSSLEIELAHLTADVTQLKADVTQLKAEVAGLRNDMTSVQVTISRIESRLDNFATKDELHIELHKQTWRIYGAMTALVAAVYFIARYVH